MTLTALGLPTVPSRFDGPGDAADAPTAGPLVDTYGRVATDLRVSLTDRCNLRCSYCMPADGLDWLPGEQLLRPDELARLMHIAVTRLGVTSVRFTGGEPLLARHLEEVVAAAASLRPRPEISLTTNGVGLARRAAALSRPAWTGSTCPWTAWIGSTLRPSPAGTGSPMCWPGWRPPRTQAWHRSR